jgi:hypothetical protein
VKFPDELSRLRKQTTDATAIERGATKALTAKEAKVRASAQWNKPAAKERLA